MIDKYVFARCQKVFGICLRAFVFSVHKPCLDGGNKRSVRGQGLGPLVEEEEEVCRLGGKAVARNRLVPPLSFALPHEERCTSFGRLRVSAGKVATVAEGLTSPRGANLRGF